MLIRITSPHFVAGIELEESQYSDGEGPIVINAAPILKYMKLWTYEKVVDHCSEKGWEWEIIKCTA